MTLEELMRCTGANVADARKFVDVIDAAMAEFDIDTPARQAAFLAQVGHESGGLHWTRELWGPSPAQTRYEGRADLGNIVQGDGSKFRGRGLIQTTGRANYRKTADALDLPLLDHPEILETPTNAARSAAWFWKDRGLNELADTCQFEKITRRVNGGLTGYDKRLALYETARDVFA